MGIKFLNRYEIQARLAPALIILFSPGVLFSTILADFYDELDVLVPSVFVLCLALLLCSTVRELGLKAQEKLVKSWGSMPADEMLCHSSTAILGHTKSHYFTHLQTMWPDIQRPSKEQEEANRKGSLDLYSSIVDRLIIATSDQVKFQEVFRENCNFGFCRNLYGAKRVGIVLSVVSLTALVCLALHETRESFPSERHLIGAVLIAFTLLLLSFWVSSTSVWHAGQRYGRALFKTIPQLSKESGK